MTLQEAQEYEAAERTRRTCPICKYSNLGKDPRCHGCGWTWPKPALSARDLAAALIEIAHRCGDIHITPDRMDPAGEVLAADVQLGEYGDRISGDAIEIAGRLLEIAQIEKSGELDDDSCLWATADACQNPACRRHRSAR